MIALGRTDGRFIRHNVYGYSPLLSDVPFSEVLKMEYIGRTSSGPDPPAGQ